MSRKHFTLLGIAVLIAVGASTAHATSISVLNPSFQSNANGGNGYGSITSWTSAGGAGTNTSVQPFATGTTIPDFTQVAFQQGVGTISQSISGLDTTKQYWFQIFYNRRQGGGNGNPGLQVNYGAQSLASVPVISTVGSAYTFLNVPFTPATSGASLSIGNPGGTGDHTLLFDGISVIQRDANQVVIKNPSFEGSQATTPGNSSAIAGWTKTGAIGTGGINPIIGGSSPFSIPTIPDGIVGALLQNTVSLSQVLPGLVSGQQYTLEFYAAKRGANTPTLSASVGSHNLLTNFAGLTNSFVLHSYTFTANGSDVAGPTLTLANTNINTGDNTLFIDNVKLFAVPEPSSLAMLAFGMISLWLFRRKR